MFSKLFFSPGELNWNIIAVCILQSLYDAPITAGSLATNIISHLEGVGS